jgi:CRISPR type IV-associated protein Csf2
MRTILWEGTVTALSSIAHSGGQTFGISTKLRREKFVQPDGRVEEIPVISGNSLRGLLRDRGMLHMCKALGYGVREETGEVMGLSLPAFHFLFSGGALTSQGDKTIDIGYARRLRELIPLVGVFGGAVGNVILPGKLKVGKLIPICAETAHVLPERFVEVHRFPSPMVSS